MKIRNAATWAALIVCGLPRILSGQGGVSEWLKEAVLKTAGGLVPPGGSNPSPSARQGDALHPDFVSVSLISIVRFDCRPAPQTASHFRTNEASSQYPEARRFGCHRRPHLRAPGALLRWVDLGHLPRALAVLAAGCPASRPGAKGAGAWLWAGPPPCCYGQQRGAVLRCRPVVADAGAGRPQHPAEGRRSEPGAVPRSAVAVSR